MERIWTPCSQCGGSGEKRITTLVGEEEVVSLITCPPCAGSGRLSNTSLDSDLIDLLNDMNNRINDIFEKVNEV